MRELCLRCFRPISNCYCRYASDVDCGIKFVFLMHPKEAKRQRTGTGRLASICLPGSEIIMGIDFTQNERLNSLLNDERYFPMLMYPGEDAWNCGRQGFKEAVGNKQPLVIIIDSTWFCSKKMIRLSKNLHKLPKLSFKGSYKSIFTFKKEPYDYCVSTIESCYYIIKELHSCSLAKAECSPEPLMYIFRKMIEFQLSKKNERIESGLPGSHAYDWKYTRKKEIPNLKAEAASPKSES